MGCLGEGSGILLIASVRSVRSVIEKIAGVSWSSTQNKKQLADLPLMYWLNQAPVYHDPLFQCGHRKGKLNRILAVHYVAAEAED